MMIEIKVVDCPCCRGTEVEPLVSFGSEDSLLCLKCGCSWFQSRRKEVGESEA